MGFPQTDIDLQNQRITRTEYFTSLPETVQWCDYNTWQQPLQHLEKNKRKSPEESKRRH